MNGNQTDGKIQIRFYKFKNRSADNCATYFCFQERETFIHEYYIVSALSFTIMYSNTIMTLKSSYETFQIKPKPIFRTRVDAFRYCVYVGRQTYNNIN